MIQMRFAFNCHKKNYLWMLNSLSGCPMKKRSRHVVVAASDSHLIALWMNGPLLLAGGLHFSRCNQSFRHLEQHSNHCFGRRIAYRCKFMSSRKTSFFLLFLSFSRHIQPIMVQNIFQRRPILSISIQALSDQILAG